MQVSGHYLIIIIINLIIDLFKRFPDGKKIIGPGIQDIILQTGIGTDRYFLIIRVDGSWDTCGYKNGLSPKSNLRRFIDACRNETSRETSGDFAFSLGKPPGIEVHHVIPFIDLVEKFIKDFNIDIDTVKVGQSRNRTPVFVNAKLRQCFMEYCRQNVTLRLLGTNMNPDL